LAKQARRRQRHHGHGSRSICCLLLTRLLVVYRRRTVRDKPSARWRTSSWRRSGRSRRPPARRRPPSEALSRSCQSSSQKLLQTCVLVHCLAAAQQRLPSLATVIGVVFSSLGQGNRLAGVIEVNNPEAVAFSERQSMCTARRACVQCASAEWQTARVHMGRGGGACDAQCVLRSHLQPACATRSDISRGVTPYNRLQQGAVQAWWILARGGATLGRLQVLRAPCTAY
jgi:hypothetical protein